MADGEGGEGGEGGEDVADAEDAVKREGDQPLDRESDCLGRKQMAFSLGL